MSTKAHTLALVLAPGLLACGESAPPAELRAATYNAGLAPGFVDYAEARAPVTTEALAEEDADLLCVQEYFVPEDWEDLVRASGDRYTEASYLDPMPAEPGSDEEVAACSPEEFEPLLACVEESCSDAGPDELTDCALAECGEEVDGLSDECFSCVAANIGSSIEEIIDACADGTGTYAYDGSFGIGLLSGPPMQEKDSVVLDSHLTRRGVLYGLLDREDFGEVHVFCTHLSPIFSSIPFPGEGSWEEEQRAQIETLLTFVDDKVDAEDQVMILGDLNTGPEGASTAGEQPANYAELEAAGFQNPYLEGEDAECTYCGENLLVGGDGSGDSKVIDHVLVRGIDAAFSASRIMTGTEEIELEDEGAVTTPYSDHYGVFLDALK